MSIAIAGKNWALGGLVAGLGAIVGVVAAFVPVESVNALGISASTTFWDGNAGKTLVVVSLIALALAAAWLRNVSMPKLLAPVGIVLCGLVALLVVAANWGSINDDVNAANGLLAGAASVGIGLYLTAVAGIVIIVGGALGFVKNS